MYTNVHLHIFVYIYIRTHTHIHTYQAEVGLDGPLNAIGVQGMLDSLPVAFVFWYMSASILTNVCMHRWRDVCVNVSKFCLCICMIFMCAWFVCIFDPYVRSLCVYQWMICMYVCMYVCMYDFHVQSLCKYSRIYTGIHFTYECMHAIHDILQQWCFLLRLKKNSDKHMSVDHADARTAQRARIHVCAWCVQRIVINSNYHTFQHIYILTYPCMYAHVRWILLSLPPCHPLPWTPSPVPAFRWLYICVYIHTCIRARYVYVYLLSFVYTFIHVHAYSDI